jgi:hypothetical protein
MLYWGEGCSCCTSEGRRGSGRGEEGGGGHIQWLRRAHSWLLLLLLLPLLPLL